MSISKVDKVKNNYRLSFEGFREHLMKFSENGKELCGQVIPRGIIRASNAEGIANVVMAHTQHAGKVDNEQAALIPLMVDIVKEVTKPFVFNDEKLVDSIISKKFESMSIDKIELPDTNFMVEVPQKIKLDENLSWDVATLKRTMIPVIVEEGVAPIEKDCFIFTFVDSSNFNSKWLAYFPKSSHIFSEDEVINDETFDKVMGKSLIILFKLMRYILESDKTEVKMKEKCGKKASSLIKNAFGKKFIVN